MNGDTIDDELADEIHSVCRTTVGDELRSITYFTEDDVEQLYLRSDLEQTADLIGFADHERLGFHSQSAYRNTQLGEYEATIRMFENGFLASDSGSPRRLGDDRRHVDRPIRRTDERARVGARRVRGRRRRGRSGDDADD